VRRCEKPIHHFLVSVGRVILQEGVHFFRGWRQADEVEGYAADERCLVRFRGGLQPFLLQSRENEGVDGVNARLAANGDAVSLDGLERPVIRLPVLVQNGDRTAPLRALVDPRAELADLGVRQPLALLRRHLRVGVDLGQCVNQVTLGAFANDDHRPAVTAVFRVRRVVEPQPAALPKGAVTVHALRGEDRLDVGIEVDLLPGRRRELGHVGLLVVRAGEGEERN
jgi:hypothetical protein